MGTTQKFKTLQERITWRREKEEQKMRKKVVHAVGVLLAMLGFIFGMVLAGGEELSPLEAIATELGGIAALFVGAWLAQL